MILLEYRKVLITTEGLVKQSATLALRIEANRPLTIVDDLWTDACVQYSIYNAYCDTSNGEYIIELILWFGEYSEKQRQEMIHVHYQRSQI